MTLLPSWWLWLFPATYLAHLVEEGFFGERFYRWIRRVVRRELSAPTFFVLNAVFLAVMLLIAGLAAGPDTRAFAASALGALTMINGAGHLIGSLVTRSYSPGVVTGTLIWIPLGVATLAQTARGGNSVALGGIAVGCLAMIAVAATALLLTRPAPSG